jgi:Astacin (Peptidase family M12A)
MNENGNGLRDALTQIAEVARAALSGGMYAGGEHGDGTVSEDAPPQEIMTCTPKALPKRLLIKAGEVAARINPVNAPAFGPLAEVAADLRLEPLRIAVMTAKYWGPAPRQLTVSFMDSTPADLRARIISHMNAWTRTGCISFVETQGTGNVRISRGAGGYWSYLGTDILLIPRNRPTMNLQGFTMNTPESEYKRVVRHETGHTLGCPHEHMRQALVSRIDSAKAYDYFRRTQGWDKQTVDQQVLTPLSELSLMGTLADQTSIMCYQLPGSITRDGQPIIGGVDINQTDYAFVGRIYPKLMQSAMPDYDEEWDESEDVEDVAALV